MAVTIEDLKGNSCRWPFGDPQEENFHFCGDKKSPGASYCDSHMDEAYKPTTSRKVKDKKSS